MTRSALFTFLVLFSAQLAAPQVITSQKEAERIYRLAKEEDKNSQGYFANIDKCRTTLKVGELVKAEAACRLSLAFAEKLPPHRFMEKRSANQWLGIVLSRRNEAKNAIVFFEKALEAGKSGLTDSDAETGDIYFLLAKANHSLRHFDVASSFYAKAEDTYRAAFANMIVLDDDGFVLRQYAIVLGNILRSHLVLANDGDMSEQVVRLTRVIAKYEFEFAEYLK
jgi:tetratricopeptide (TPR) repeat protein